jgi:hypothetical protein
MLLSFWGTSASPETSKPSKRFDKKLKDLVQEAQRWSATSTQDTDPLVALMHATYGMGYLRVARTMASDADIERACNLRLDEFAAALSDAQHSAMQNVTGQCSNIAMPGLASLNTGWLATDL